MKKTLLIFSLLCLNGCYYAVSEPDFYYADTYSTPYDSAYIPGGAYQSIYTQSPTSVVYIDDSAPRYSNSIFFFGHNYHRRPHHFRSHPRRGGYPHFGHSSKPKPPHHGGNNTHRPDSHHRHR